MNIKIKLFIIIVSFLFVVTKSFALEFIVRGSVDEIYDDNVNASSENPESDWVTNLMLGVGIRSEGRARELELSGNVYQRYCLEHEERNDNYQYLMLYINKSFSENIAIMIIDVFHHDPESRTFGTLFGRSEADTGYVSNAFSSGLTLYVTRKLFLSAAYNNSILKNDSDTMLDSVFHNAGGAAGYSFNSANTVRAGYLYSLMKYDDDSETRGDRVYAEYEKYITKQLRSVFHGGYDHITMTEGETSSSRWMASLIDDVDENNELNITYLNEITISDVSNDSFENWRVTGTLSREVSDRASINISLFYGEGTFRISRVRDKLGGASFVLTFNVSEFVNFNTGYTYTWSSTDSPGSEETAYNRNQISAGLSAEY